MAGFPDLAAAAWSARTLPRASLRPAQDPLLDLSTADPADIASFRFLTSGQAHKQALHYLSAVLAGQAYVPDSHGGKRAAGAAGAVLTFKQDPHLRAFVSVDGCWMCIAKLLGTGPGSLAVLQSLQSGGLALRGLPSAAAHSEDCLLLPPALKAPFCCRPSHQGGVLRDDGVVQLAKQLGRGSAEAGCSELPRHLLGMVAASLGGGDAGDGGAAAGGVAVHRPFSCFSMQPSRLGANWQNHVSLTQHVM